MIKSQLEDVGIDEIMLFIEDTLRYFNKETEEEHKTNQHFIEMQNFF